MAAEVTTARESSAKPLNLVRPSNSRSRYIGKIRVPRNVNSIPDREYNAITRHLEKRNADNTDAPRYLEREAMTDRQLGYFYAVAEYFSTSYRISDSARANVRKWRKLAFDEIVSRK